MTYLLILLSLFSTTLLAHPVIYKNGYEVTSMNMKSVSDNSVSYSYTSKLSQGIKYVYLKPLEKSLYLTQAAWLAKRWNMPDAQGNIYLTAATGVSHQQTTQGLWAMGFETDYETRKIYAAIKYQTYHDSSDYYMTQARLGFAPYVGAFDDIHTWIILQVMTIQNVAPETHITPMLRLFYRNVLGEIGSSIKGDINFNFMVHY